MSSAPLRAGNGRRLGLSALALVAGTLAVSQSPAHAATAAVSGQWTLTTPATNDPDDSFRAVDGISSVDMWSVGATSLSTSGLLQNSLIEHWDGARWKIIPSPNRTNFPAAGPDSNVLRAVDAISADDVWAVGETDIETDFGPPIGFAAIGSGSLAEHWNGQFWSIVPSPPEPLGQNFFDFLDGVSGTSADDVWAVGSNGAPGVFRRATIDHWDGTAWTRMPAPAIGNDAQNIVLEAVTAVAPDDVWTTGYFSDDPTGDVTHPLTLHWDGVGWSVVPGADVALGQTVNQTHLSAVKAVSPNNVWAVGNVSYVDANGVSQSQALIEHWNGAAWSIVRNSLPDAEAASLTGLAQFAADDIWSVGTIGSPAADGARDPLVEHFDGTSWSTVSVPRPDKTFNCGFFGAFATADGAGAAGGCVAADPTSTPRAVPLAEVFSTGVTPPPPPAPPAAPSNLTGTSPDVFDIQLDWQDSSNNEGGFVVERCKDAGCANYTQIAVLGPNITSYLDSGFPLAGNSVFSYRVRAFNLGGVSEFSNIATVATETVNAPSDLTATVLSARRVQLNWRDNSNNETEFDIERCLVTIPGRCDPGSFHFDRIAVLGPNATSYVDRSVTANTTYVYVVFADDGDLGSPPSNFVTVITSKR